MIPISTFAGKSVALFGLGGSGIATAHALAAGGARVFAWDDAGAGRAKAEAENINVADLYNADWRGFDALVLSPGVPLTHPAPHWTVERARAAGVEIIGDIELFCREREARAGGAPFVAITGTNGKSTTTALIAHILREAGRNVELGGNIGTPILALEPPDESRIHVIECSSFQIDLAPSIAPTVGILINLSPDHIDRHGSFSAYVSAKARLLAAQQSGDVAVLNAGDPPTRELAPQARGQVWWFSRTEQTSPGAWVDGDWIVCQGERVVETALPIRGAHNLENALAAVAAHWFEFVEVSEATHLEISFRLPTELSRGFVSMY